MKGARMRQKKIKRHGLPVHRTGKFRDLIICDTKTKQKPRVRIRLSMSQPKLHGRSGGYRHISIYLNMVLVVWCNSIGTYLPSLILSIDFHYIFSPTWPFTALVTRSSIPGVTPQKGKVDDRLHIVFINKIQNCQNRNDVKSKNIKIAWSQSRKIVRSLLTIKGKT